MKFGRHYFLPLIISCLCIASSAQDVSDAYTALNGNWHLTGEWASKPFQAINLSLGIDGRMIYGEARLLMPCISAGRTSGTDWEVFVEGRIASDGSFVLGNQYDMPPDIPAHIVSIHGTPPAVGSTEWSGSFDISAFTAKTSPTPQECPAVSGSFIATQFPPLNGVYEGTIRVGNKDNEAYVSLDVAQGKLISTKSLGAFAHVIPLDAKITVTGSSSLPSNTFESRTQSEDNNRIAGNTFQLHFLGGNDGTTFQADGSFSPSNESRIRVNLFYVSKDESGKLHTVHGDGWLTRQ